MFTSTTFAITLLVCLVGCQAKDLVKRDTAVLINQQFGDFKENCYPIPSGGCSCTSSNSENEAPTIYKDVQLCKKPIEVQTFENKMKMNEEFKKRVGSMRENCFPKPSGGCKCVEGDDGEERIVIHKDIAACQISAETRVKRKVAYMQYKPNCSAKAGGGCICTIHNRSGLDTVQSYYKDSECKVATEAKDPVREAAQANYAKVVEELNNKFKGLRENCYPRPKGCMCIVGKDSLGHDINERRMTDSTCKCADGEVSKECPKKN
uniref:Thyroglobulin type-1 domain-containing protein n=1 Tax=Rhabditophanes sp. KR3021 TaxID=114890 RepID=A0AC35U7A8_9BILA